MVPLTMFKRHVTSFWCIYLGNIHTEPYNTRNQIQTARKIDRLEQAQKMETTFWKTLPPF